MPIDYEKFFKQADVDNSGCLSLNELVKACRAAGFRGNDSQIKAMFDSADCSGDNKLTMDEFLVCMGQQPPKTQKCAAMRYVFNSYDTDGNGYINRSEVKNIWAEMGKVLSDEELEKVMSWLDKDGDDKVQYEEFLAYYQSS